MVCQVNLVELMQIFLSSACNLLLVVLSFFFLAPQKTVRGVSRTEKAINSQMSSAAIKIQGCDMRLLTCREDQQIMILFSVVFSAAIEFQERKVHSS